MATVKQVLDVARNEIGVKESPANSNKQKYGEWYGWNGAAWCCIFICWLFNEAKMPLPYKTASCSSLLNWYKKNRPQSVYNTPKAGDVIIYNFGHTGIVESVGTGKITAIEGNTSSSEAGSQSNGGMVCRKTRSTSLVTAYIRPDYDKETTKMLDNTPSPAHCEGVNWCKKNGLLAGDTSGNLKLSEPITRQQFCTMLYRFAKFIGKA